MSVADEFDALNIAFFYGNDSTKYELFSIESIDDIINHAQFNASMKTLLYIHGFRENLTSESVETIVRAFTKRGSYNKLVLNWSAYANGSYVTEAIPNLIKVTYVVEHIVWEIIFCPHNRSESSWGSWCSH